MKRIFILALCTFAISTSYAARLTNLSLTDITTKSAVDILKSHRDTELTVRSVHEDLGKTHTRYYQTYRGVQIWPQQIAVATKGQEITNLNGVMVQDLDSDVQVIEPAFNADHALELAKNFFRNNHQNKSLLRSDWKYESVQSNLRIYIDEETHKGHLAYVVSFFADTLSGGNPTRPTQVIDARTGQLLLNMEGLTTNTHSATGDGGNLKTGKYTYGKEHPHLEVSQVTTEDEKNCVMETARNKTIDLKHTTWQVAAYAFSCSESVLPMINGAYGPMNDAHYFAGVILDMFQNWYQIHPLNKKLVMKVHYTHEYENAFWDGQSMVFGDGKNKFYPLVSLDVSAHEVAHGFTEFNSGLIYRNQSGGINESFSDMAGEAAEYYARSKNDFEIGAEIFKAEGQALRYLADPTKDKKSISHISIYIPGMNVHYSSGIFNKAFYMLATTPGWNTKKAFDIFVKANRNYWTANTDFVSGAKGVLASAKDLGYPTADVIAAFKIVGIRL